MPHIAKQYAYRSTLKGRIEAEKIGAGICKPNGTIRFCRPYYERQGCNRDEQAEHRSQSQPMVVKRRHKARKEEEKACGNQLM